MTDKIREFRRINEPRAKRAAHQLDLIWKSGQSMRIDFEHVHALIKAHDLPTPPPAPNIDMSQKIDGDVDWDVAQPVRKRLPNVEALATTDLIDWALAAAVEIARRRK